MPQQLEQPWKQWYNCQTATAGPSEFPINAGRDGGSGNGPAEMQQVDLSKEKEANKNEVK
jgi:hypothetical protein